MWTSSWASASVSVLIFSAALSVGCASRQAKELTFSAPQRPASKDPFPNWYIPPTTLDKWIAVERETRHASELRVEFVEGAGGGVTGAYAARVFIPKEGVGMKVKWKGAPGSLDGLNNSPRRELAPYEIQKLFLDPEDYVVPTSAFRCVPLEQTREYNPKSQAQIDGTKCELGLISAWMKEVTLPEPLYDETRFSSDPAYAYYMSNFNLLTYLIGHKDGRGGNFLVAKDEKRPQVFAVDNGVAFDIGFGGIWFNWFVPNWNKIRVPALRKESVDRLRTVRRADLDSLGVLVEMRTDDQGMLQPVVPGKNLDPSKPARIREGAIQLGLKKSEINDVWERIQKVIKEVDQGDLATF